jgi:hypothetical protein
MPDSLQDRDLAGNNSPVLGIDRDLFRERYEQRHFTIAHDLVGHPLFEIPRLLELAQEVSTKWPTDVHYDTGITEIGQRWDAGSKPFPVDEAIRRIETAGAWIDLRSADRNPDYAKVLDACVADILRLGARELKSRIRRARMAIFITSPNRLSTYHIDFESNFLLHLRGEKDISIFDRRDREVITEEELERSWTVDANAPRYRPETQRKADVLTLLPGMGVHIPTNAPHWVQNGNTVSVSAAILCHWWDRDYANVYAANHYLRKALKINPTPPFRSKLLDTLKQPLGAGLIELRRRRHGPLRKY